MKTNEIAHHYSLADLCGADSFRRRLAGLSLGCDARIPRSSIGYVAQLCAGEVSSSVRYDAIAQLSRYVVFR